MKKTISFILCIFISLGISLSATGCGEVDLSEAPSVTDQSAIDDSQNDQGNQEEPTTGNDQGNQEEPATGNDQSNQEEPSAGGEQEQSDLASAFENAKALLASLATAVETDPFSYVPNAMRPDYSANFVNEASVTYDFGNGNSGAFVNVSSINCGGFGEQWNMVVENLMQSETFYSYLNKSDSAMKFALKATNAYLDKKSGKVSHENETDAYKTSLSYSDKTLVFSLEYKQAISLPIIGSVKPKVDMTYDSAEKTKTVKIALTETNLLRYEVTDNSYTLGMEYGVSGVNRTTYLSLSRSGENVAGHIYEYLTVAGHDTIKSCADFYVQGNYISVVGNKASGMKFYDGYICELYEKTQGKLLGYKVQETKTILGVTATYNTLWFNLSDVSGISKIKVDEKSEANESSLSTVDVYLNGSETLFTPTYNKKGALGVYKKTSRKYDVELRTRYFYNTENEKLTLYEIKNIPMMFIQDGENFDSFLSDVASDNDLNLSVSLSAAHLAKIRADYDTILETFKTKKDNMSSAAITAYVNL